MYGKIKNTRSADKYIIMGFTVSIKNQTSRSHDTNNNRTFYRDQRTIIGIEIHVKH